MAAAQHTMNSDPLPVPDPWNSSSRRLRPIVYTRVPKTPLTSISGTGDISQPVATTTLWADPSNHATTYGVSATGYWRLGTNLFAQFLYPTQATYLVGFAGTIQSGTVQMDLELLDASSNILTSASMLVSYVVNLINPGSFDYAANVNSQTAGTQVLAQWNAVRVRSTCSNTNLNSLLNFGPFGSGASPTATLYYTDRSTVVGNVIGIG
jgi:hypothetical protein